MFYDAEVEKAGPKKQSISHFSPSKKKKKEEETRRKKKKEEEEGRRRRRRKKEEKKRTKQSNFSINICDDLLF